MEIKTENQKKLIGMFECQQSLQQMLHESRGLLPAIGQKEVEEWGEREDPYNQFIKHCKEASYYFACSLVEMVEVVEELDEVVLHFDDDSDRETIEKRIGMLHEELVDVWHFIMSIGLSIGFTNMIEAEDLDVFNNQLGVNISVGEICMACKKGGRYKDFNKNLCIHFGSMMEGLKYKHWKTYKDDNGFSPYSDKPINARDEYEDLCRTFLAYCNFVGLGIEPLFDKYVEKNKVNFERQTDKSKGYV